MRAIGRVRTFLVGAVVVSTLCFATTVAAQGTAPAGKIHADSAPTSTNYAAKVTDAENNALFYKWASSVPCGKVAESDADPSTAAWDRTAGTPCTSTDPGGLVWVHVTDILNFVGCYYKGAATGDGPECVRATEIDRRISILFKKKSGKLIVTGAMRLAQPNDTEALKGCIGGRLIDVEKQKGNAWIRKKTVTTTDAGKYSAPITDKSGTYRVTSPQVSVAQPGTDKVDFYNCYVNASPGIPHKK
ncbi:MAG: hypothetical protein QOK47_109 [Actinomycetota bacterium]|nr:hypothetical protein [Actinomycetota bacterium]